MSRRYMKKYHEYSSHPVWFQLYCGGVVENEITRTLLKKKDVIQKWIKETRLGCKFDKEGYNYRFASEKDFTMFLLRWGS